MQTKLINPQTLAALKDLSLVARMVVAGFTAGLHNSLKRGAGLEFSQYRSYQPGDDLRQLDWKMFARSDRYYIRESETDTNLRVQFVVDASNSMNYEEAGMSKITYVKLVVACLGYLAVQQGDEISLHLLHEDKLTNILPAGSNRQLPRFFTALYKLTATGRFATGSVSYNLLQTTKKKTITVFLSDMYEQETEITDVLNSLRRSGQEVILLHLLGQQELNLAYPGAVLFEDLENGERIQVDSSQQRLLYEANYQTWLQKLTASLRKKKITYDQLLLHEPLDKALRLLLKYRLQR